MGKHSKEFGLKGQSKQTDSLETILSNHMRRTTEAVYGGKTLDSVRYGKKEFGTPPAPSDLLTELLRDGARFLIAAAVQDELQQFMDSFKHSRLPDGKASVVKNGYLPHREVQTGVGPVRVRIPRVRSRDGSPVAFQSALVPRYVRKAKSIDAALPWLYLKGLSTGEMGVALEALLGPEARGFSPSTVSRLKNDWAKEYDIWRKKELGSDEWAYIWADGIYGNVRGDNPRLCMLVVIGVNRRGEKRLLSIEDGVRESRQSWKEVLLALRERGLREPPKLAVGDGALGFWAALGEVYPQTREQRCWVHKTANVLNYLPRTSRPKARRMLHDIWQAETRERAEKSFDLFLRTYEDKYPRAAGCLVKDREELMTFYEFPAKHWRSIRTTNPIESTFGTIRHRTRSCKGCLSLEGMLHMMFKLGVCAEKNWRKINGFDFIAKVITGIKFRDGIEQTENKTKEVKTDNWVAA